MDVDSVAAQENFDFWNVPDSDGVTLVGWSFRSVQQRMILRDSLLTRQAGGVDSLQSLSRDAVLLILSTNNSQERLVTPLVDRLEGEITKPVSNYSERNSKKI